jgi:hypothetical protein
MDVLDDIHRNVNDEVQQDEATTQQIIKNDKNWTGKHLVLGARPADPKPLPDAVKKLLPPDSRGR